jgi:hypothetical protein
MTIIEALGILGLSGDNITPEDIRRAFKTLAKKYHPDATGNKDDTMFKKINEAYSYLQEQSKFRENLFFNDREDLKIMLDNLIYNALELFDSEIYTKIVIPELKNWFENSRPLKALESEIRYRVNEIKPYLEKELTQMYDKFSKNIGVKIDGSYYHITNSFNFNNISETLSDNISDIIGLIVTAIIAVVSGGSGVALIASGPLGIILGGALGLYFFSKNKEGIRRKVEDYVMNNSLPITAKNFVRDKVIDKLSKGEEKFIKDLEKRLKEDLKPIYERIELIEEST